MTTTAPPTPTHPTSRRDVGGILPMVLVVSVVLGAVVLAVASYTSTTLRYGTIVEERADRLAAAEAAMNDALERLRIVDELCTTSSGAGQLINPDFPAINDVPVGVTCTTFGGELPPSDGWAIVVTGQGPAAATAPFTFITDAGGNPVLEGPVFVHDPTKIKFKSTTIKNGSLWYTGNEECTGGAPGDTELYFRDSAIAIPNLGFDPATRKVFCVNRSWLELFSTTPPIPDFGPPLVSRDGTPAAEVGECKVFEPGVYAALPQTGAENYFRSGVYLFDNLGMWDIKQDHVTFGSMDPNVDHIFPVLPMHPDCETARSQDLESIPEDVSGAFGATVYLGGSTRIYVRAGGQFEIGGREQGDYIVALHALPSSAAAAPTLLETQSGGQKDSAFSGLVWAPQSRIEIGTVSVSKDAAFRGGMVVGMFEGTVSNSGNDTFLIRVPTTRSIVKLLLEAVATGDDGGITTIRVIAEYRPSRGDLAVNSWRVCPSGPCT